MKLTLSEASEHIGVAKATISRAIKRGELSADKSDPKNFQIDVSELSRWDSSRPKRKKRVSKAVSSVSSDQQNDNEQKINALENTLKATQDHNADLQVQLQNEREQLQREREKLDRSEEERRQAQAQIAAFLTDQRPQAVEPKKGFIARLLGN